MSVTLLVPILGVFWSAFLLDEIVTPNMLARAAVVLAGTALALGLIRLPALR